MERGDRTRQRLISSTADLLRRQGFSATGMTQILKASGASRGSLYFHFPGGKEELVLAALRESTRRWRSSLQVLLLDESPENVLPAACAILAKRLEESDWQKGCPVATITLEMASTNDEVREICEEHFRLWETFLHDAFARRMSTREAASWATVALASIEGALLLSRAYRDSAPLIKVGQQLSELLVA
jgi:TetR/AcrR family transcriptional repressor of lmrAB and yxaGH operons